MSVLDRNALEASPLADIHAIASELSIDGYRRLRRADLIDAILEKQEGGAGEPAPAARRSGSRRAAATTTDSDPMTPETETAEAAEAAVAPDEEEEETSAPRRRRGRRGGRGRAASRGEAETPSADEPAGVWAQDGGEADAAADELGTDVEEAAVDAVLEPAQRDADDDGAAPSPGEEQVEGVVELLANGSGFVRVDPPEPSDDDVYISSAQVKRCELISGDRIAGPKRAPRRSERFASLIRIETINGRPASELADSVRFDDLPAAFPSDRIAIGSDDPTLKAIEWLTPFGQGSRVVIVGDARAGKSEALRRLARELAGRDELTVSVVLAGVRPEEISQWDAGPAHLPTPVAAVSIAGSEDAGNAAVEPAIDQARRLAARGADTVVLIDTLDGCSPGVARKALASARNIVDGGSVTVIATASAPLGGETTVIALDHELTSVGRFPAIDIFASGTMHPELLIGEEGAEAITRMRIEAGELAAE